MRDYLDGLDDETDEEEEDAWNGGVIGVPVDTATHVEIEGVEDWTGSSHGEHGTELDAALSVKEVRTLSGDTDYYEEDGTIRNRTTYRAVTDYSEFIVVPRIRLSPRLRPRLLVQRGVRVLPRRATE
jgi:hypothetical protein